MTAEILNRSRTIWATTNKHVCWELVQKLLTERCNIAHENREQTDILAFELTI